MLEQSHKIRQLISAARLACYETAYAKSISADPIALYQLNCALRECFYPLLQTIEVSFRNSVYTAIALKFNDLNWLRHLRFLQGKEKEVVSKVMQQRASLLMQYIHVLHSWPFATPSLRSARPVFISTLGEKILYSNFLLVRLVFKYTSSTRAQLRIC